MKKFGEPNDVANLVYFLSSNEAFFIYNWTEFSCKWWYVNGLNC